MADEITITTTMSLTNGTLVASFSPTTHTPDQSTAKVANIVQNIGTSEEAVDFGDIAAANVGYIGIQNHDATNFIKFGPESGGSMVAMGRVKPGETAVFRIEPSVVLRAQADTAACDVQFCLFGN